MASPSFFKDGTVRECVSLAELVICLRSSGRGRKKYIGEAKNKESSTGGHTISCMIINDDPRRYSCPFHLREKRRKDISDLIPSDF